jgi:hypothetical protein
MQASNALLSKRTGGITNISRRGLSRLAPIPSFTLPPQPFAAYRICRYPEPGWPKAPPANIVAAVALPPLGRVSGVRIAQVL